MRENLGKLQKLSITVYEGPDIYTPNFVLFATFVVKFFLPWLWRRRARRLFYEVRIQQRGARGAIKLPQQILAVQKGHEIACIARRQ